MVSYETPYGGNQSDALVPLTAFYGDDDSSDAGVLGREDLGAYGVWEYTSSFVRGGYYCPNLTGYVNQLSFYVNQTGTDYPELSAAIFSDRWSGSGSHTPCRLMAYSETWWTITNGYDGYYTWNLNGSLPVGENMEYWLLIWQKNTTKTNEGCRTFYDPLSGAGQDVWGNNTWQDLDPWPIGSLRHRYITANSTLFSNTIDNTTDVYLNERCQTDFDDVRFSWVNDTSGIEESFSYCCETVHNGDNASMWMEVPEVSGCSLTYVYLYYGNDTYSSASDSSILPDFDFFDDFDGSAEPPTGWNETNIGSGWLDVSENSYYLVYNHSTSYPPYTGNIIWRDLSESPEDFHLQAQMYVTDTVTVPHDEVTQDYIEVWNSTSSTSIAYMGFVDSWTGDQGRMQSRITGTSAYTATDYGTNTYLFEIVRNSTHYMTYYTIGMGGSRTLLQTKAETAGVDRVRVYFRGTYQLSSTNPSARVNWLDMAPLGYVDVTYAWMSEEEHDLTVTYYFQEGGVFQVNGTSIANGSSVTLYFRFALGLGGLGNTSMIFNNFSISYSATTEDIANNPYLYNNSQDYDLTVWCLFRAESAVDVPYIIARFHWNNSQPVIDDVINFNGSASASSSTITLYEWSFGDGDTGSGLSASHTYTSYGNYTVVLNVTSAAGENSTYQFVTIGQMPTWLIELDTLPNWDVVVMTIFSLFFTSLFLIQKKVAWGIFSFAGWLIMGMLWLFINPVSYFVGLLFMGIAIIILILTLIVQLEAVRLNKRRLGEERIAPV